jgi:hypothetical protein
MGVYTMSHKPIGRFWAPLFEICLKAAADLMDGASGNLSGRLLWGIDLKLVRFYRFEFGLFGAIPKRHLLGDFETNALLPIFTCK